MSVFSRSFVASLLCCVLLAFGSVWYFAQLLVRHQPVFAPCALGGMTVVIDAGHGGEDGGAVSADGIQESQLNLALSQRLRDLFVFCGVQTKMTRESDISLHDANAKSIREKKRSDLAKRVALVQETPNPLLLSIHQNAFPDSRYGGLQVFYASAETETLAKEIQSAVAEHLAPHNKRQALPVREDVYLMQHINCPALLVECGFLSNPEDASQLQNPNYQKQLSITFVASYLLHERERGEA